MGIEMEKNRQRLTSLVNLLVIYTPLKDYPVVFECDVPRPKPQEQIHEEFANIQELAEFLKEEDNLPQGFDDYHLEFQLEEYIKIGFGDNIEPKKGENFKYQFWVAGDITTIDSTYSGDVLDFTLPGFRDKGVALEDVHKTLVELTNLYVNLRNFIRTAKEIMWKEFGIDS